MRVRKKLQNEPNEPKNLPVMNRNTPKDHGAAECGSLNLGYQKK